MSGQVGAQSPTEPESGAGVSPNAVSETSQRPNGARARTGADEVPTCRLLPPAPALLPRRRAGIPSHTEHSCIFLIRDYFSFAYNYHQRIFISSTFS